jgi:RNA polymerase sigma-70 factor (ECF subfamily)
MPPPRKVNTPAPAASNTKEIRAKEALEDRALVERVQAGDKEAFRTLVERHQRRAFSIAMALVRDENDARELVQEGFLRVYKNIGGFQGQSSFFTWLYRIITNLSIDLIRKPGRQVAELDENRAGVDSEDAAGLGSGKDFPFLSRIDGADPADVVRRGEIAIRLREALAALPDYHRGVILMREVEGLSYEEMAQAMKVSKGTIMSRLFHARQKLQKALVDCYREQIGSRPADGPPSSGSEDSAP